MKKGFALITVLAVAIVVALGAAGVLQSMGSYGAMKATNLKEVRYRFLAEAAMVHALYQCRTNAVGCAMGQPVCCASEPAFTINIVNLDGTNNNIPVPIAVLDAGGNISEINVSNVYADA